MVRDERPISWRNPHGWAMGRVVVASKNLGPFHGEGPVFGASHQGGPVTEKTTSHLRAIAGFFPGRINDQ